LTARARWTSFEGFVVPLLLLLASAPADLVALGVVTSPRPEACVALLHAGGRTRSVAVGEPAFGGRLLEVSATAVTLAFDDERVVLRLGGEAGPRRAQAPRPQPAAPAPVADETTRDLPRKEVDRRLALEIPRILAETTLVPASDATGLIGFSITRMPEGSLLSEVGLRTGDILTRLNGVAVDSLATLISLWPRLQTEPQLSAVVLRRGQPVTLTVNLR
jgi:type II secretory pathway component PulC